MTVGWEIEAAWAAQVMMLSTRELLMLTSRILPQAYGLLRLTEARVAPEVRAGRVRRGAKVLTAVQAALEPTVIVARGEPVTAATRKMEAGAVAAGRAEQAVREATGVMAALSI
jgi:hypothetical protein